MNKRIVRVLNHGSFFRLRTYQRRTNYSFIKRTPYTQWLGIPIDEELDKTIYTWSPDGLKKLVELGLVVPRDQLDKDKEEV